MERVRAKSLGKVDGSGSDIIGGIGGIGGMGGKTAVPVSFLVLL